LRVVRKVEQEGLSQSLRSFCKSESKKKGEDSRHGFRGRKDVCGRADERKRHFSRRERMGKLSKSRGRRQKKEKKKKGQGTQISYSNGRGGGNGWTNPKITTTTRKKRWKRKREKQRAHLFLERGGTATSIIEGPEKRLGVPPHEGGGRRSRSLNIPGSLTRVELSFSSKGKRKRRGRPPRKGGLGIHERDVHSSIQGRTNKVSRESRGRRKKEKGSNKPTSFIEGKALATLNEKAVQGEEISKIDSHFLKKRAQKRIKVTTLKI